MTEKKLGPSPQIVTIDEYAEGQRIDNYLFSHIKGVPKSRIYRALRNGEFRVNKKRVDANYRLRQGDLIRIPPLRVSESPEPTKPGVAIREVMNQAILYEDNDIIIINKPSGIAAHGGSGINFGVIELLRDLRPRLKYLELVHRLDRDTTGCMVLGKKPSVLKDLHRQLAEGKVEKTYLALVAGQWQGAERKVNAALLKNVLNSGERRVILHAEGKSAETIFRPLKIFSNASLVEVKPLTGRTHQIRVHAAHLDHPILGDDKYGARELTKSIPVKHLMLHAGSLRFKLLSGKEISLCACLDSAFLSALKGLYDAN